MCPQALTEAEYEAEKAVERAKRIELLKAFRAVIARKLKLLNNDKPVPLKDLVPAVRMVSDQLRLEFKGAQKVDDDKQPTAESEPEPDPLDGLKLFRPAG
jgi:hypothetical protein